MLEKKQTMKDDLTSPKTVQERAAFQASPNFKLEDYIAEIRARAAEIYARRGNAPGDALSDWLQAEREIKNKHGIK
jgi:hypothetical protein